MHRQSREMGYRSCKNSNCGTGGYGYGGRSGGESCKSDSLEFVMLLSVMSHSSSMQAAADLFFHDFIKYVS
ncbi:hypothetical protein TNIN_397001 [Trichonephila inaurata madagascariensis]|uniref:Uncharacterized protein n=1 Tax=Trichonephila inaurata madagascariensis TaxID=2747483 RepID=A0A8X7C896_9ARAC|nr:hypothetical protein TNIN_397001 [Trichonephila inaurata madagascariensis]